MLEAMRAPLPEPLDPYAPMLVGALIYGTDIRKAMKHHVRVAIYDELNANDIEIPFNPIVVHQAS